MSATKSPKNLVPKAKKIKIITWVFCEDCFHGDDSMRECPNYQTSEVKIKKAKSHFDSFEVTFDCPWCKLDGRKWKNKKSLVEMTTNQPHIKHSGVTHPYL